MLVIEDEEKETSHSKISRELDKYLPNKFQLDSFTEKNNSNAKIELNLFQKRLTKPAAVVVRIVRLRSVRVP